MPEGESVVVTQVGPLVSDDITTLKEWPSGEFILQAMLPKYADSLPSKDPKFWQTCARKALLKECGFLKDCDNDNITTEYIQQTWEKLADQYEGQESPNNGDDNDLIQFFKEGGKSNHRNLQWSFMDCAPGCQFRLHAHPNLELVYCVKGELHEIRLDDDDHVLTKSFEPMSPSSNNESSNKNENASLKGPSLIGCQRPWKFLSLPQGKWLVNRVGTIHKSFTATNGEGCVILALWGGSHANIVDEPKVVSNALDNMDEKLTSQCAGCHPTSDELARISETFLPDSEKSSSSNRKL